MTKKQKSRYFLAIYLLVFTISIIFALIGIYIIDPESIFQSMLIGLATELLGVVLIFFLVDRLFAIEDVQYMERIEKLLERIASKHSDKGLADRFLKSEFTPEVFHDQLSKSTEAFFWGVTLTRSIPILEHAIEQGLKNNSHIKFLLIEPPTS